MVSSQKLNCIDLLSQCHVKFDNCMIWQGPFNEDGYGYTRIDDKQILVHKYVALWYPDIPNYVRVKRVKGYVRQKCGILTCINPKHLSLELKKPGKVYPPLNKWWENFQAVSQ